MLQISISTIADGGGDLHHFLVAFGVAHDLLGLHDSKAEGQDGAYEANPEKVFHKNNSFIVYLALLFYHIHDDFQVQLG
jgi:hypothetical protein